MTCQLRNVQIIAMQFWFTTIRTSCSLLTHKRCRRHLTTCHTINGIINKDNCKVLTTVQSMECLCCTNTGKVTITLISEYQTIFPKALNTRCNSWSTSVRSLLPVNIEIAISKHGTAYRTDSNCLVIHSHILDYFCN